MQLRIYHHALARQMIWERVAFRRPARKAAHMRRRGNRMFRRQFVFRGAGLKFLEGECQLINEPCRAFRFLALHLAIELCDPHPLLRNQRRVFRSLRERNSQLRSQGGVFLGKSGASGIHETK